MMHTYSIIYLLYTLRVSCAVHECTRNLADYTYPHTIPTRPSANRQLVLPYGIDLKSIGRAGVLDASAYLLYAHTIITLNYTVFYTSIDVSSTTYSEEMTMLYRTRRSNGRDSLTSCR